MENINFISLDLLDQIEELLLDSTRIPFTGGRIVDEQYAIDLLDALRNSIPKEIIKANKIIQEGQNYIKKAQIKSNVVVKEAQREKERLLNSTNIKNEAELKVEAIYKHSKVKCEEMIRSTNEQVLHIQQKANETRANLQEEYTSYRNELIHRYKHLKSYLEKDIEQYESNRKEQIDKILKGKLIKLRKICQKEEYLEKKCKYIISQTKQEARSLEWQTTKYSQKLLIHLKKEIEALTDFLKGQRFSGNNMNDTIFYKNNTANIINSKELVPDNRRVS